MRKTLLMVLLALVAGLAGCADTNSHPPSINLRTSSEIERRATLSILRRTWEDRPMSISDDHCWYERRLLDRSAYFGRKIRGTESYESACKFWMDCVREHIESYDDERYKRR